MKRLVICFDGTWNFPENDGKPTNVVKLVRAVKNLDADHIPQLTFYDKGVGTGGPCDKWTGGIFGFGLENNVIDGFRFVGNNYQPGDEIYVFGFSRGAYTARSFAGLVSLAGVFKPNSLGGHLKKLIEINKKKGMEYEEKKTTVDMLQADRFTDVKIKCVGVWDTVGSLGIPGDLGKILTRKQYRFHDVGLSSKVDVALHAISIDEKRLEFSPTLWDKEEGAVPVNGQVVEQVWFPGVHSNIGGSYPDEGLSDIALDWMTKRVGKHTDLELDNDYLSENCNPNFEGRGRESRKFPYYASFPFPYQRLINQTVPEYGGIGSWVRNKMGKLGGRNILNEKRETLNEAVHISAIRRWGLEEVLHDSSANSTKKNKYRPINLGAVIKEKNVPIIGDDGEPLPPDHDSWP